jgi:hypothetical protein
MTPMRTRMIEQMRLAGLAPQTQEVYLQGVQTLVKHCGNRRPEQLTEEEVRRHILDVQAVGARGTFETGYYGIRFFYCQTLDVDWDLFKKRFACRSKSDFRRFFPMPRSGAFSTAFATRSTAAASA